MRGKSHVKVCSSKRRFISAAEALEKANGFKTYHCPVCAGFHLTSQGREKASSVDEALVEKPSFDTSILARAKWRGRI